MILKVERLTAPLALMYALNKIATTDAAMDAARQGPGKNFSRQIPNGSSQPNTYQELRSVRQCHSATRKLTLTLAAAAICQGHLGCPAIIE